MARPPSPRLLIQDVNDITTEILAAPGMWMVLYQGQPAAVKRTIYTHLGPRTTYIRTGFNNAAHCYILVDKLNAEFNTQDFSAFKLIITGKNK